MTKKKKTLQDIFEDDDLGLLDSKPEASNQRTEDQRLIDSFEEINTFYEKEGREPKGGSISEMKLASRLKGLRENPAKIEALQQHDRFNLLKAKKKIESIEDIFDDDSGLLDTDDALSIFELKNVPAAEERAEADFVAQRKPMKKELFQSYEEKFKKIHEQLRTGERKLISFNYEALKPGEYYIHNGILLYLESVEWEQSKQEFNSGSRLRTDGRTKTIFENGTMSNMMYRSLYKNLQSNGKMLTQPDTAAENELFKNANLISEEDLETGWIYILKSKSTNPKISEIKDLYKIGFSRTKVEDRIKNAAKEPTYLNADVEIIATYKCYNLNPQKFENLLHRFFAEVCLSVDIHDDQGRRITPREWFVVPLPIVEKVISLILKGNIIQYNYDPLSQSLFKI